MCCWSPKETRAPSFCRNSSLKKFPVEISIVMRRNFLWFLSGRRNAFEIEILAKSAGGKSLLHCGKCLQLDSALKEDMSWHIYVSAFRLLLLDINHEIIFYSNQTDRVKLMSTYKNKKSSRPGRYSRGLIKLWSVEIYGLVSLFCYLERFLFLLLLLRQMFSKCGITKFGQLTEVDTAREMWNYTILKPKSSWVGSITALVLDKLRCWQASLKKWKEIF